MFAKEAKRSFDELDDRGIGDDWNIEEAYENGFSNGAEFGYCRGKEEARKIIGNLYAICKDNHYPDCSVLMEQAEQFLK